MASSGPMLQELEVGVATWCLRHVFVCCPRTSRPRTWLPLQILLVVGGAPHKFLTKAQRVFAWAWCPCPLLCNLSMAIFDAYSSCTPKRWLTSMMLVYTVYCCSHVCRFLAYTTLQPWCKTWLSEGTPCNDLLASGPTSGIDPYVRLHPPPIWQCIFLLVVAVTLFGTTMAEAIADYFAHNLPEIVTQQKYAWLVSFGYAIGHMSFTCCLGLILASVERARKLVKDTADEAFQTPLDWDAVQPRYMQLVDKLHQHCSLVRTPAVLSFLTLSISSLACGIGVWYIEKTSMEQSGLKIPLIVTQFMSFACWSALMLMLLKQFSSVQTEVNTQFVGRIKEQMRDTSSTSRANGPQSQAQIQSVQHRLLVLIQTTEPAGWFLFGEGYGPIGERLLHVSAFGVLINAAAKLYELVK